MKDKFYVKFNGGLGNQMFQWAMARMLEESGDMEAFFDMSYFRKRYARPYELGIFNLEANFVEDFWTKFRLNLIWSFRAFLHFERVLGITLFAEKQFNFDSGIHKVRKNTYIEGFFQSELYFKMIEEQLRKDFQFKTMPSEQNSKVMHAIKTTNSVSLHIRRGDYVQKKRYQNLYANCSLDYYKRGVEHIAKTVEEPTLFIFSDDIAWVKKNLRLPYKCVYISHNTGAKSFEDMRLMSLCKHNVIANSSFSWWGAWLNNKPEKIVIAPQKWFNDDDIIQTDVIPSTWTRLEN